MTSLLYCWEDFDPDDYKDNISIWDIQKFEEEQMEMFRERMRDEIIY